MIHEYTFWHFADENEDIKARAALLAFCEKSPPVPGACFSQGPVMLKALLHHDHTMCPKFIQGKYIWNQTGHC